MRKCIYCSGEVENEVVDFCNKCGVGAFGEKMFSAILQNMREAIKRGDFD